MRSEERELLAVAGVAMERRAERERSLADQREDRTELRGGERLLAKVGVFVLTPAVLMSTALALYGLYGGGPGWGVFGLVAAVVQGLMLGGDLAVLTRRDDE